MELLFHVAEHAFFDSLNILPFLFAAYLLMEFLEHRAFGRLEGILSKSRGVGPVVGALLGCLPQCGFSVAAADLYAGRAISLGTLVAVFIATSDEAVPVLLSRPGSWGLVGGLLLVKLALGAASGLGVDAFLHARRKKENEPPEESVEGIPEEAHDCGLHKDCGEQGIFRSALGHTVNIFLFVLLTNFLLGGAVELLGEETLSRVLLGGSFLQPLVAALIGLIPNCAASVILTSLYLEGTISFGAMAAGLSTGAGVGLMVLFRANKRPKENLIIVGLLVAVGGTAGMLLQLVG